MALNLATAFVRVRVDRGQLNREIASTRSRIIKGLSGIRVPVHLDVRGMTRQAQHAGKSAGKAAGKAFGLSFVPHPHSKPDHFGSMVRPPTPAAPPWFRHGPRPPHVQFAPAPAGSPIFPTPPHFGPPTGRRARAPIFPGGGRGGGFHGGGRFAGMGGMGPMGQFGAGFGFGVSPMLTAMGVFGGPAGMAGILAAMGVMGAGRIAGAGVGAFADFEQAFKDVEIVQKEAGATEQALASLEQQARSLAQTTIFSATEAATAMSVLTRRGFDAVEVYQQLPNVLNLAAAGSMDVADAAGIVAAVQKQFGKEAGDTQAIVDILAKASLSAATDVRDLGLSLSYVGPLAKLSGKDLQETVAALMLLRDAGLDASRAGTGLTRVLTKLSEPKVIALFRGIGVEVRTAEGRLKDLDQIIREASDALQDLTETERVSFAIEAFGQRGGPAFAALMEQGADALRANMRLLDDFGGTAERVAREKLDTINEQFKLLGANLKELGIVFGETFEDEIKTAISAAIESVQALTAALQVTKQVMDSPFAKEFIADLKQVEGFSLAANEALRILQKRMDETGKRFGLPERGEDDGLSLAWFLISPRKEIGREMGRRGRAQRELREAQEREKELDEERKRLFEERDRKERLGRIERKVKDPELAQKIFDLEEARGRLRDAIRRGDEDAIKQEDRKVRVLKAQADVLRDQIKARKEAAEIAKREREELERGRRQVEPEVRLARFILDRVAGHGEAGLAAGRGILGMVAGAGEGLLGRGVDRGLGVIAGGNLGQILGAGRRIAGAMGGLFGDLGLTPEQQDLMTIRQRITSQLDSQRMRERERELGVDSLFGPQGGQFRPQFIGVDELHRQIQLGVLSKGEKFMQQVSINTEEANRLLGEIDRRLELIAGRGGGLE